MEKRRARLRVIDPTCAASKGGARMTVQGLWFKGPPTVLTIQLSIPLVGKTVEIPATFATETQLSFVLPDVTALVKASLAEAWVSLTLTDCNNSGTSTSKTTDSPRLRLVLYPEITTKKVSPMHLPLSATSDAKISLFLNNRYAMSYILTTPELPKTTHSDSLPSHRVDEDLSPRLKAAPLVHLTSLPVFVRVSYVSDKTKTSVQVIRAATWNASSAVNGELMLEFDPPRAAIGIMQVHVTLNKVEFFESLGYTVLRDYTLCGIKPRCLAISNTHNTEVVLSGDYFLETGEIIVQLQHIVDPSTRDGKQQPLPFVNLNGMCTSPTEITTAIPPKSRHGLAQFAVSCNHGEHFCLQVIQGLLYRERLPIALLPTEGSIAGGTPIQIQLPVLEDDAADSFQLLRSALKLTKVIRVKFEPEDTDTPAQVVYGEPDMDQAGVILCTSPGFDTKSSLLFHVFVSISLDGVKFHGRLPFTYFGQYTVRSLSMHHGPNSGGTHVQIRMNHPVPANLPIAVKFTSKGSSHVFSSVVGRMDHGQDACVISCTTPPWPSIDTVHLTKVQVSLNQGVDYIPPDDPTSNSVKFRTALDVDDSFLLFLFYTPPQINYIWPTSSSQEGGGVLRLKGLHLVDHGGTVSVVFSAGATHRKVRGFIELDPTRHSDVFGDSLTLMCCAPSFALGCCDIYVSLNDQQYTKCSFQNIVVPTRNQFLFFKAPAIVAVSPICSPSQVGSTVVIQGVEFIDTGSIQVRFTYTKPDSDRDTRQVAQFVEGKLDANGAIVCQTPVLKIVQSVVYSRLDLSLNSCEYTDIGIPFVFYRQHRMTRVEPAGMALQLCTTQRVYLQPEIVSDRIKVRLKVAHRLCANAPVTKSNMQPVVATSWSSSYIDWECPPLASVVSSPSQLIQVQVEVALNGQHFLEVGNLLSLCSVYSIPKVDRIWPIAAPFEHATELHIFGDGFDPSSEILVRATIPGYTTQVQVTRTLVATFISPEQIVVECPSAADFSPPLATDATVGEGAAVDFAPSQTATTSPVKRGSSKRRVAVGGWKVIPISLELATRHDQFSPLPFGSQFYFPPTTLSAEPLAGFTSGGTVVSLKVDPMQVHYMQLIEDQIPLLFGDVYVCGSRRDNEISCVVPPLPPGNHLMSMALNQQAFQPVKIGGFPVHFEAFPPPLVACPDTAHSTVHFGPVCGGTPMEIQGHGFVATGVTLVMFEFPGKEYVVEGKFVTPEIVTCLTPRVDQIGRAKVLVSCNGQQYSHHDSLSFEFHAATTLALDFKCAHSGSIRGGTVIQFHVSNGLPVDLALVRAVVNVVDPISGRGQRVTAEFDPVTRAIWFATPAWPQPAHVHFYLSLNNCVFFVATNVTFLYYTPPPPIRRISPAAGPITGQTWVVVECPGAIDTGEVAFRLTSRDDVPPVVVPAVFAPDGTLGFISPPVDGPHVVSIEISLNGLDYPTVVRSSTSSLTKHCAVVDDSVAYQFYTPPQLLAMTPQWGQIDADTTITLHGDHIADFGAPIQVQIIPWQGRIPIVMTGSVVLMNDSTMPGGVDCDKETGRRTITCLLTQGSVEAGYYRVEFSLNGQQYTESDYPDPRHMSPLAVHKIRPLFPFRVFAPPFFLATTIGATSGGSRVLACGSNRFIKMLLRTDCKCHIQFTPVRWIGQSSSAAKLPDSVMVSTEVDVQLGTVLCRAPPFRFPCVATVELLLGDIRNVDSSLVHMAKEKFHCYDSPTITEVVPSCGPLTGGSILTVQATHVIDTNQVHVRFQCAANKHAFCVVPGKVSNTFPDGTTSKTPLILCRAPRIERMCEISPPSAPLQFHAVAMTMVTAHHTRGQHRHGPHHGAKHNTRAHSSRLHTSARLNRPGHVHVRQLAQPPDTLLVDESSFGAVDPDHPFLDVLVDFSLNGGEQFLPRSAPFRFYTPLTCTNLTFGPLHVPQTNLDLLAGLHTTSHRLRQLVLTGFEAPALYDSKCAGIKFESITDDTAHELLLPCSVQAGSVVCDLPHFPTDGKYRVSFALNSQEFTQLHDPIQVHRPVHIMDCFPRQFPFQGGHHMTVKFAASSVADLLRFAAPTAAMDSHPPLSTLKTLGATSGSSPSYIAGDDEPVWRPRRTHHIEVIFADESRPSRGVIQVTARNRVFGWIVALMNVDVVDSGAFDVDATDWEGGQVVLTVHLNDNYNTFRRVVRDMDVPTQVVLVKKPSSSHRLCAVGCFDLVDAAGNVAWTAGPKTANDVDIEALSATAATDDDDVAHQGVWYFIRVNLAKAPRHRPDPCTSLDAVLLLSHDQTIVHEELPREEHCASMSSLFVVGAIQFRPGKHFVRLAQWIAADAPRLPPPPPLDSLQVLDDAYQHWETPEALAPWTSLEASPDCALHLTVSFKAGDHLTRVAPQAAIATDDGGQTYTLQCVVPTTFTCAGPVTMWLAINDICFSNPYTLRSYDPRQWKLESIEPACGLHGKSTPVKVRGVGFVETHAIQVRFGTPTHVVDVPGHIRLRQFLDVAVVGLSVAGRTYSENSFVFSLLVQYNDDDPVATGCRRMLYHLKKDLGTVLWNETLQFEVLGHAKTVMLTLRAASDVGDLDEGAKMRSKTFKTIATGKWVMPDLQPGMPCRQVVHLDNSDRSNALKRTVELTATLNSPLQDTEMIVAQTPPLPQACSLSVQITCGQYMWHQERADDNVQFHVYELPRLTQLKPPFIPYTTGGTVSIRGQGFFNSGMISVRAAFLSPAFDFDHDQDDAVIQSKLDSLLVHEDKMVELPVAFVSTTELRCDVPPKLQSRNAVFCVSFDRHTYTPLTVAALLRMFDMSDVVPSGGPIQGHSFLTLHGTNLSLCQLVDHPPVIRFSMFRNQKLIERSFVHGELHGGILHCYTPPCRLGLDKLHVMLDVSLGGPDAAYSNDGVPFVYYKVPVLRSLSPTLHLVPGATDVMVHTVECWENSCQQLPLADRRCRFRMKGQAQTTHTTDGGNGIVRCRLPRFTVPVATPQLLSGTSKDDPNVPKLWIRNSGLFVTVLRARNLKLPSNGSTGSNQALCPVVLLSLENQRLRSATKDYSCNPVFNQQFDFELCSDEGHRHGDLVITVEHEVKSMRNEVLGTITFPLRDVHHTVLIRAWFSLNPPQCAIVAPQPQRTARQVLHDIAEKDRDGGTDATAALSPAQPSATSRGEIELFIHFEPMVLKRESSVRESTLRGKLRSVMKKTMHAEAIAKRVKPARPQSGGDRQHSMLQRAPMTSRRTEQAAHVIPNEIVVELALNGQDFISQCPITYYVQPLPVIESIAPKCIPSRGGSKLSIHGHNFVDTKCIRIAFLWGVEHYAALKQSFRVETDVFASVPVTVVNAKFDSPTHLVCTTPPTKGASKPCFTLLVALNGMDFNSIFLPPEHDASSTNVAMTADDMWNAFQVKELAAMPELPQNEWKVFETPVVHTIQSANATYTTKLIFRGENFGSVDNPKAKFVHVPRKGSQDIKLDDAIATLSVMSSMQMECWAPDFPPGSVVQIKIAMNGHDFIDMPGTLVICNAPKILRLDPSWVFASGNPPLRIVGSNFVETGHITVSFTCENSTTKPLLVRGTYKDGAIHCAVPTATTFDANENPCSWLDVDVSLGKETVTAFTGQAMRLQLYHHVPECSQVSPSDGPIWGGTTLTIRGANFVATDTLSVRFTLLQFITCPKTQQSKWQVVPDDDHCVMVRAGFDSTEVLTCVTPSMPSEGPVSIQVSLNDRDFSPVTDSTWFVMWRTWQTRISMIKQSMHQDGGARLAWQKHFELKHTPKLNFYSGRLKTTSWKIQDTHHPRTTPIPPKRVDNLPEILRDLAAKPTARVNVTTTSSPTDADDDASTNPETELYIPPNIVWPEAVFADGGATSQTPNRLVELLRQLYRSPITQQDIYSRLIFMYDNAALLNAKYTSAPVVEGHNPPTTPGESPLHRRVSFPPLRRAASSSIDLKKLHRQRTGLCFKGLAEGIQWIFPHATETDIVELWVFLGTHLVVEFSVERRGVFTCI
ncbi:hypothetical protein, variant [Aphanomyces invadans]|uniref:C2 domain-containing protein n=1 Tax=Aphanomyces invadans TaxID=157072 RepID=A0A024T9U3_9STRA|nr:hypothetical protein, variant [Aphanomyces invadans]ETV90885.1 hypothetical protein, variant [Aphanomyces invadans]|eukprot:XP_008880450.1 hypothetical protein, variant [Aphanomyces invadans]